MDHHDSLDRSYHDSDIEMIPISTAIDQVAGSLRQLRDQFQDLDDDVEMDSPFEDPLADPLAPSHRSSQPLRLLVIDTNILIGHLSLIESLAELLIAARKLRRGSSYRCGLLIPKMVRLELDKHKMPHNKHRIVTTVLEPPLPSRLKRLDQTSIHSPQLSSLRTKTTANSGQSVQISLLEAADQAIKWMTRLLRNTHPDHSILMFQTKSQVLDPSSLKTCNSTDFKVSPDMHILDCAAYFKQQVEPQGGGVILLTNDKALSLEAELEGISTLRIQPGLSPYSLLNSFDPTLAPEIDTLLAEVPLTDMLTSKLYPKLPIRDSKNLSDQAFTHRAVSEIDQSYSGHDLMSSPKTDHSLSQNPTSYTPQTHQAIELFDETSSMAIEIDEAMMCFDLENLPHFPPLAYQQMLVPSSLHAPRLLHFHQHIQLAFGALLRERIFKCLLSTLSNNDLALLFRHVDIAFERRKTPSRVQIAQDPNLWTAVDCLALIDHFWNEAALKMFEDEVKQSLSSDGHPSNRDPKSRTRRLSASRWAPTTPFASSEKSDGICSSLDNRLSRMRKAVQVLVTQLGPYTFSNLPRDNPLSWSLLFWEGLIEDIHKVAYYGRFYQSFSDAEEDLDVKKHSLQKVIQNWKFYALRLCQSG